MDLLKDVCKNYLSGIGLSEKPIRLWINTVIWALLYLVVLNIHSVWIFFHLSNTIFWHYLASKMKTVQLLNSWISFSFALHFLVYVWNKIIGDKICILLSGTFELTDSERHATGTITVELKWKFVYLPPSGSTMAADLVNYIQNEKSMAIKLPAEEKTQTPALPPSFASSVTVSNLTNSEKLRDIKDLLQQFI